ncbi:unnamed protein product [Heterobilharzia americana]|nr:unnamed protein product [Heterobilharzia americana]
MDHILLIQIVLALLSCIRLTIQDTENYKAIKQQVEAFIDDDTEQLNELTRTMKITEGQIVKKIENINKILSAKGQTVNKYFACQNKHFEGKTGVELMKTFKEIIRKIEGDLPIKLIDFSKNKECLENRMKNYTRMTEENNFEVCQRLKPNITSFELSSINTMTSMVYNEIQRISELTFKRKVYEDIAMKLSMITV